MFRPRMVLAAWLLWAAFLVVGIVVKAGWTVSLDTRVILALRAAAPGIEPSMQFATALAAGAAAPLAILIALLISRRARARQAWMYAFACLGGWLVNLLLKETFRNVRPHDISPKLTPAGWFSFPSGHAMMAMLIFGFGAYLLAQTLTARGARIAVIAFGLAIALAVGLSRVWLGAHWPSDVLGAYIAAAGWAAVCLILEQRADVRAAA